LRSYPFIIYDTQTKLFFGFIEKLKHAIKERKEGRNRWRPKSIG
jgi:hypothetical protein